MPELLGPLSLKYNPVTLANDKMYMALTYQDSDRVNIGTSSFSSHVSVTTLSRMGAQAPVLMMGAGSLAKQDKTAAGIVNLDFTIRSDPATWNDVNGDFKFTEGSEMRTTYELAAAVTKRNASAISPEEEARVVVTADSDWLADMALRHRPQPVPAGGHRPLAGRGGTLHRRGQQRGGRPRLAHPQAGPGLVLPVGLPGARRGAGAGPGDHPQAPQRPAADSRLTRRVGDTAAVDAAPRPATGPGGVQVTGRSVAIQAGLALLVLVLAYTTWQRPPEKQAGEVFVLDITKNDLEKVRFEDQEAKSWSELAKGKDDEGTLRQPAAVRLRQHRRRPALGPSGHRRSSSRNAWCAPTRPAEQLFERFAPLRAQRALGVLDAAKLKELGLDKTKKFVEVTARGVKRRFAIVSAPPGRRQPLHPGRAGQARSTSCPAQVLSDLQAASTNLVERRLHAFRVEDVDRLVITAGGKKKELVAARIEDFPGIRLAPAETPDKPDPTVKNWHDRVFSLFPTEVLGKGEVPASGRPDHRRAAGVLLARAPASAGPSWRRSKAPAVSTHRRTRPSWGGRAASSPWAGSSWPATPRRC